MNIKKAKETLKTWLGIRPNDQYVSYQALENILEALDEPMEYPKFTYDIIREGIFKENEILKSELANAKQCNETLSDMLARANGLVKNLESKLRVEGYRIEVKDSRINHLKTVLRANGVVINDT